MDRSDPGDDDRPRGGANLWIGRCLGVLLPIMAAAIWCAAVFPYPFSDTPNSATGQVIPMPRAHGHGAYYYSVGGLICLAAGLISTFAGAAYWNTYVFPLLRRLPWTKFPGKDS